MPFMARQLISGCSSTTSRSSRWIRAAAANRATIGGDGCRRPDSYAAMVDRATPDRSPSSCWVKPAAVRSCAIVDVPAFL
ncbi:hypothetical protein GCM10009814_24640 [Lapillicoccus jejuensis]